MSNFSLRSQTRPIAPDVWAQLEPISNQVTDEHLQKIFSPFISSHPQKEGEDSATSSKRKRPKEKGREREWRPSMTASLSYHPSSLLSGLALLSSLLSLFPFSALSLAALPQVQRLLSAFRQLQNGRPALQKESTNSATEQTVLVGLQLICCIRDKLLIMPALTYRPTNPTSIGR